MKTSLRMGILGLSTVALGLSFQLALEIAKPQFSAQRTIASLYIKEELESHLNKSNVAAKAKSLEGKSDYQRKLESDLKDVTNGTYFIKEEAKERSKKSASKFAPLKYKADRVTAKEKYSEPKSDLERICSTGALQSL